MVRVHTEHTSLQRSQNTTSHRVQTATSAMQDAVETYTDDGAGVLDGQVALLLLFTLQHNDTQTAHMDDEASCREVNRQDNTPLCT